MRERQIVSVNQLVIINAQRMRNIVSSLRRYSTIFHSTSLSFSVLQIYSGHVIIVKNVFYVNDGAVLNLQQSYFRVYKGKIC